MSRRGVFIGDANIGVLVFGIGVFMVPIAGLGCESNSRGEEVIGIRCSAWLAVGNRLSGNSQ